MSKRSKPSGRDERGETLLELVIAIAILGVAGVAILSALGLTIKASVQSRNLASGGAYVRSFAEAIQNSVDAAGGFQTCANAVSVYGGVSVVGLPATYTKTVTAVQSWNGAAWAPCVAADDPVGLQRLDLKVTTPGNTSQKGEETLTVVLRQPCNGAALPPPATPCG